MVEQEYRDFAPERIAMDDFLRSLHNSNIRRESFISGWLAHDITGLVV